MSGRWLGDMPCGVRPCGDVDEPTGASRPGLKDLLRPIRAGVAEPRIAPDPGSERGFAGVSR